MRKDAVTITFATLLTLVLMLSTGAAWGDMDHSAHHGGEETAQTAEGVGEIRDIQAQKGEITLHHEPMPDMNWPAMTMVFTLDSADLVNDLEVGDRVRFTMQSAEGEHRILELAPL